MIPEWLAVVSTLLMFAFGILVGGAWFGKGPFWKGVRQGLSLGLAKSREEKGKLCIARQGDELVYTISLDDKPEAWIALKHGQVKELIQVSEQQLPFLREATDAKFGMKYVHPDLIPPPSRIH